MNDLLACGADEVIVHVRIVALSDVPARYNLNVPHLNWNMVECVQNDVPGMCFTLNGELTNVFHIKQVIELIDRIIVGRIAPKRPYTLAAMHSLVYDVENADSPWNVACENREFNQVQLDVGVPLCAMTQHLLSLLQGVPGVKQYRRHLSTYANHQDATIETFDESVGRISTHKPSDRTDVTESFADNCAAYSA